MLKILAVIFAFLLPAAGAISGSLSLLGAGKFGGAAIGTPVAIGTPNALASGSSVGLTISSAINSGDLACVALAWNSSNTLSSVSDGTNTYTPVLVSAVSIGHYTIACKINATAKASGTITATFSGNVSQPIIGGMHVSGVTALDISVASTTQTTTPSVATGTLSSAPQILFGGIGGFNATGFTEDPAFTNIFATQQGSSQVWATLGWRKVVSTASTNYSPTLTATLGNMNYGVVSFK